MRRWKKASYTVFGKSACDDNKTSELLIVMEVYIDVKVFRSGEKVILMMWMAEIIWWIIGSYLLTVKMDIIERLNGIRKQGHLWRSYKTVSLAAMSFHIRRPAWNSRHKWRRKVKRNFYQCVSLKSIICISINEYWLTGGYDG